MNEPPKEIPQVPYEVLESQVKVLETANLELQARALQAEIQAMQATMALIGFKGPVAENQLAMVLKQLEMRQAKPQEAQP